MNVIFINIGQATVRLDAIASLMTRHYKGDEETDILSAYGTVLATTTEPRRELVKRIQGALNGEEEW